MSERNGRGSGFDKRQAFAFYQRTTLPIKTQTHNLVLDVARMYTESQLIIGIVSIITTAARLAVDFNPGGLYHNIIFR